LTIEAPFFKWLWSSGLGCWK